MRSICLSVRKKNPKETQRDLGSSHAMENNLYLFEILLLLPSCVAMLISNEGHKRVRWAHVYFSAKSRLSLLKASF